MTIDTVNSEPVSQNPYPIVMKNYQWVKDKREKLLTAKSSAVGGHVGQHP